MDDQLHLNNDQKINANNNTISVESRTFADQVEANILFLIGEEELAIA